MKDRIWSQPPYLSNDEWTEIITDPTIEEQDEPFIRFDSNSRDNPDPEENDIFMVEDEEETKARAAKALQDLFKRANLFTLQLQTAQGKCTECEAKGRNIEYFQEQLRVAYEELKESREQLKNARENALKLEERTMQQRETIGLLENGRLVSSARTQALTQRCTVIEQHCNNLKKELMDLANYYILRTRSPPSTKNLVAGHISISIHGEHFAFIGPQTTAIYLPSKTVTMHGQHLYEEPVLWRTMDNSTRDICEMGWDGVVVMNSQTDVFGENGQVVLNCETEVSSPAGIDGDELKAYLKNVQPAGRITHFALGENPGTMCLSYVLPSGPSASETPNPTQQHITEIVWPGGWKERASYSKRVWFGKDDVWVVEKPDGTYTWSDKLNGMDGYYYGLTVALTNDFVGCKIIKALSMDKLDGSSWVLVFGNGAVACSPVVGFDKFHFEEWASQNFGCDFGLVEKPAGYGTAPRYGRVEEVKKEDE